LESTENEKIRKVFVDYENFMSAVIDIHKNKGQPSKFGYDHLKEFFRWLAQNKKTKIFCYYKDKEVKEEERKTRFVDYFPILERQLRQEGVSFNAFSASRVSVDSRILVALATMIKDDRVEQIYLVSGDGDYAEMLQLLREQKKKIIVVSGKSCCSGLLKEVADKVQYIDDILDFFKG